MRANASGLNEPRVVGCNKRREAKRIAPHRLALRRNALRLLRPTLCDLLVFPSASLSGRREDFLMRALFAVSLVSACLASLPASAQLLTQKAISAGMALSIAETAIAT